MPVIRKVSFAQIR